MRLLSPLTLAMCLALSSSGWGASPRGPNSGGTPLSQSTTGSPPSANDAIASSSSNASITGYQLTAWGELGMHCIDGKDYSIFSILPPYNIVRAQLVKLGSPPQIITSGVTITYQATGDTTGSINTISSTKTNFWTWAKLLFLQSPPPDIGLTGNPVQSLTPHPLKYNSKLGYWEAVGVPTVPYDDKGARKPYPMGLIAAKDASSGQTLSQVKIVIAVSDEISCNHCHASGSEPDAEPASGWVYNSNPLKDPKLNILKKHDDKNDISKYLPALKAMGYNYRSSLYQTAVSGLPILCDSCHTSNGLGTAGLAGIEPTTQAMHKLHGPVINHATGTTLDNAKTPFGSCYLCHPGVTTKCQRGAMSPIYCYNCHGNLTYVGTAGRAGWLTEPSCQMCHQNSLRYVSTFAANGHWRSATDLTFATNSNVPSTGYDLYRYSKGHGGLYCSSCHGSPHTEYPTNQANDQVYSTTLQGYVGQIRECTVCHSSSEISANGGPHRIHTVGQSWVDGHHNYADDPSPCAYCHGPNYKGSFLSALKTQKTFDAGDYGTKTFPAGHEITCYDCHNGPSGD